MKTKVRKMAAILATLCLLFGMAIPVSAEDTIPADAIVIDTPQKLAEAIRDQADDQYWLIKDGTYDLTQDLLDVYKDHTLSGRTGWYLPLTADNLQIVGQGNVVITSSVSTENGIWQSQNFITVEGENVSIQGIQIASKQEINKAVEVLSKDFSMKDVVVVPQEYDDQTVNSGSIYFNPQNTEKSVGSVTLENVTVSSWISASYAKAGEIALKDVTVDFSNNAYASEDVYGAMSGTIYKVETPDDLTVKVDDAAADLAKQVFSRLPENATVQLTSDIAVSKMLDIQNKTGLVFDLNGKKITAADDFTGTMTNKNDYHLVQLLNCDTVSVVNGTMEAGEANKHVLNVYGSTGVKLENVKLDHTAASTGAPLVINGSSVEVSKDLTLVTGEKSWYAMNVDSKIDGVKAEVSFDEGSSVTQEGDTEKPLIVFENPEVVEIKNPENAGLVVEDNGVREEIKADSIKLDVEEKELEIGESFTISATISPENVDNKTLSFSSSDEKVATVDETGKVTAVAAGTAVITVKNGDVEATCTVVVKAEEEPTDPGDGDQDGDQDDNQGGGNQDDTTNPGTGMAAPISLTVLAGVAASAAVILKKRK